MNNIKINPSRLIVTEEMIGFKPTIEELEFFKMLEGKKIIAIDGNEVVFLHGLKNKTPLIGVLFFLLRPGC